MPRSFRLTQPIPAEDELHAAVAALLWRVVLPPAEWSCFAAGHVPLAPQWAAKLARLGLRRGWPDFLVVHCGKVHGIELKRPGGRLSKDRVVRTRRGSARVVEGQETTFAKLQAAGMPIAVCSEVTAVIAALVEWGIPMRKAT